jgi:hypothetical protein
MFYCDIKYNIINHLKTFVQMRGYNVYEAIYAIMDIYLSNEMYMFLSVLLEVKSEIDKLFDNLYIIEFNNKYYKTI